MTSAICHDIGKVYELSAFPANDYTDEGQLLGHIMIGAEMVGERTRQIPGFPVKLQILHLGGKKTVLYIAKKIVIGSVIRSGGKKAPHSRLLHYLAACYFLRKKGRTYLSAVTKKESRFPV